MTKLLLSLFIIAAISGSAQNTSQNWTHTDCINNNNYTLFNILDSNKVVVMEFEMGCTSCVTAATALEQMKQSYDVTNTGQVKFFLMDYWSSHTCSNVQTFVTNNNLTFGGFVGCTPDKNYYTSQSPMPMIIVTGGPSHTVYYKKLSFDSSDVPAITAAINQALNDIAANINSHMMFPLSVTIASNPALKDVYLNITSNGGQNLDVEVFNVLGQNIATQKVELKEKGFRQVKLDLPELNEGIYFVRYRYGNMYKTLKFMAGK